MDIPIKASRHNYYRIYVEILNPILKLKKREKEVLVEYLKLFWDNKDNPSLETIFTNTDIKKGIRNVLKMSEPSFNNHLKQLRDKGIFHNNIINPIVTQGLSPDSSDNINYRIITNNG